MYTDTEGIVLRHTKPVNGRKMIVLFSTKFGKISGGTSISEKGKSKSSLAMRPFTYGRYELYKNKDSYNINGAEVIKSYYKIGENIEKYMYCSYAIEFTDKALGENEKSTKLFYLLLDFLEIMEARNKSYDTMTLAFQLKAMQLLGITPHTGSCVICGDKEALTHFSIADGGIICGKCRNIIRQQGNDALIYDINVGIIKVLEYFLNNSIKSFENLALDGEIQRILKEIVKQYMTYHMDIGELKSESFLL